jgi:lipopolysaccharide biosynthesis protein
MLLNDHMQFTTQGSEFEEFDPSILERIDITLDAAAPLLLAFYLPQFHQIPENDLAWGRGYTEWRQSATSLPRFPGHYQPRIPRDLGFYNLTSQSALRMQVELAKASGIGGFAFYYYRLGHRRLLQAPLDLFLESDLDMPFVILWANHTWKKTWGGGVGESLVEQTYELEHEESLLEDLAGYFADRRYIRLGGRPLFIIYDLADIPDARSRIDRWRNTLLSRYDISPLIFLAQTRECDPRPYGLDGALEFPPHKLFDKANSRAVPDAYSQRFSSKVIRYNDFVNVSLQEIEQEFPLIKTIVPSWDNDARLPNGGLILEGSSPAKYEAWLKHLIIRACNRPIYGAPIVAINAWNEWGEGAYLEPDVYFGASYLNATARAYVSAVAEKRQHK